MTTSLNYRALFEFAPDIYLVVAPDSPRFTMVAANEARLRATMALREDVIGRGLFELFPDNPADPQATGVRNLAASLDRVIQTRAPHRMTLQKYDIRTASGDFEERFWEPLNSPVFDDRGELIYIIHRVEDVTEQVRSGSRLRILESVVTTANDAVMVTEAAPLDEPGPRIIFVNEAFTRMTGYAADEVIGRTPRILQGPGTDPDAKQRMRAALERQEPVRIELLNYRRDGSEFWVELSMAPVLDDLGSVIQWTSVERETTERRQTEETVLRLTREAAVHAEEEKARKEIESILESITDAFYTLDREWRFTYVNRRAEEILQRRREELLGRSVWEAFPEVIGTKFDREYHRAMSDQATAEFEIFYQPLEIWVEVRAYPSAAALSVYFHDITDRKRAEQALRESESRYRLLVDMVPQHIWTTDADGYNTFFSRRWYEFTGATPEQTRGAGSFELLHPEDRDRTFARWHQSLRTGEPYATEYRVRSADGNYGWFLGQAMPLRNEAGEIVGWFGTLTDISERKRFEEEREQLLTRARFLAEAGSILASSLDYEKTLQRVVRLAIPQLADWCIVYRREEDGEIRRLAFAARDPVMERRVREIDRSYKVTSGHPIAEVVRTGEPALFPDVPESLLESATRNMDHLRLLHEIGFRSLMMAPLRIRDRTLGAIAFGSAEPTRRYAEADLDLAEEIANRAAVAIDNARLFADAEASRGEAERRAKEEQALREAAAAVGAAFTIDEMVHQIARSALTATNADGALVERIEADRNEVEVVAVAGARTLPLRAPVRYYGSLAARVIERMEPELIPRLADATERISPDLLRACPACAALALPLLDAGDAIGVLILLREPEKGPFLPDEVARARTFADLASLAFRKVHLLEETERRREDLVRVMDSRARLVRGFSHDLKNPLGAADGHLQLMEEGIADHLSERQKESVGRARRSIGAALKLIDDLTELARAESGRIEIEWQPVDLRQVAREMAYEYRAQAEARHLSLTVDVPDHLPLIISDGARVRQIVGNLLSNATKYTAEGSITVRVRDDRSAPRAGRWIAVDISDTGPGISAEQQKLLFQEFQRLDNTGVTAGAGIGLAISQSLARALGGDITVESEVRKGSTFTLWLPLDPGSSRRRVHR